MSRIRQYIDRFRFIPLFIAAHFSHHVLTALLVPLLPFIRTEFDLNYTRSGLLISAFSVSSGLSQLPAGWLADKKGPRFLILVGISGVAIFGALVGISQSFLMLVVCLVLLGLVSGGYHPAAGPLITSSIEPAYLGRALGLHLVGGSSSFFLAPLIGVALASALGWRGTYLGLSVPVFVVGLVLFSILRSREIASGKSKSTKAGHGKTRFHRLKLAQLIIVLVLTISSRILSGSVISFMPLYMVDHFGVSERTAGAFLAILFSTAFWAAPLGGMIADRVGSIKLLVVLALTQGPIYYLIVFMPYGFGFAALMLLFGIQQSMRSPTSEFFIIEIVPPHLRSTILGIYFFAGMELSGLIMPVLGAMIDRNGFHATFGLTAIIIFVLSLICTPVLMVLKRMAERAEDLGG